MLVLGRRRRHVGTPPDLRAVDELCRLAVAARRLGCRIHLVGDDDDLRSLLDVAGVGDVLGRCPARAHRADTTQNGALR